jgi:hypothetical protein
MPPLPKATGTEDQSRECPRYELTEQAYLKAEDESFERLHEPKTQIDFRGIPGFHMTPLNEAAKAMVEKHPPKSLDFNKITPVTAQ